jgi:hypothetical protein
MFVFCFIGPGGAEEAPDVKTIIDRVDKLYRSDSSYGEMEMKVVSEHWESHNEYMDGGHGKDLYIYHVSEKGRRDSDTSYEDRDVELFPEDQ